MAIKALVFDLFDTLVDLDMATVPRAELAGRSVPRSLIEMHEQVRAHCQVEPGEFLTLMRDVDQELRRSRFALDLEVPSDLRFGLLVERLGIGVPALTSALVETHMRGLRAQVRAVAHHAEVLASLRRRARTALCSNFSHSPTALAVLSESGLDAHLDAVVISDAVGIRKPRAEIFEAVLDALEVAPEEALHVGDNLEADVAGAARAGLRTVWITRRVEDPDAALAAFEGPAPDWRIDDLAELAGIVDMLAPAA